MFAPQSDGMRSVNPWGRMCKMVYSDQGPRRPWCPSKRSANVAYRNKGRTCPQEACGERLARWCSRNSLVQNCSRKPLRRRCRSCGPARSCSWSHGRKCLTGHADASRAGDSADAADPGPATRARGVMGGCRGCGVAGAGGRYSEILTCSTGTAKQLEGEAEHAESRRLESAEVGADSHNAVEAFRPTIDGSRHSRMHHMRNTSFGCEPGDELPRMLQVGMFGGT